MKKYLKLIILLIIFIPILVNAETCDNNKISISSITLDSKSNNVEEISNATASGKNINLNISMSNVGDNIEYKIVVKNDSNEDYELDKKSLNLNTDYINYSFETDDSSNIVKANSYKNVTLRVEYKTEVPENQFENGSYNDKNNLVVQLSSNNTIKNPNTGVQSHILLVLIILLLSVSIYVLLKKKKYAKLMILVIGTIIIVPISVYAICKYGIKIESNIVIKEKTFSGNIYRWSEQQVKNGDSIKKEIKNKYIITDGTNDSPDTFDTNEECENKRNDYINQGMPETFVCEKKELVLSYGIEDYTLDPSELNKSYYLKHEVVDNIITSTYLCLTIDKEYCLKGDNGESYEDNKQIIRKHQEYLNLPIADVYPGCNYKDDVSFCYSYGYVGGYRFIKAYSNGSLSVGEYDGIQCNVSTNSYSSCYNHPY